MHVLILIFENVLSPSPTRHHELAVQTIRRGAYRAALLGPRDRRRAACCRSSALVGMPAGGARGRHARRRRVLALAGGAAWEYIWVEAGQRVPLS